VAAVEHGAEQLTPGRRRLSSRRTGSTAARPRHAKRSHAGHRRLGRPGGSVARRRGAL
jgi:hypothetical protein